jgi:hypothetical protein
VKLDGDLTPGKVSELAVAKGGKPVRDLQPYLGAQGHPVLSAPVISPNCALPNC